MFLTLSVPVIHWITCYQLDNQGCDDQSTALPLLAMILQSQQSYHRNEPPGVRLHTTINQSPSLPYGYFEVYWKALE